MNTAQLYILLMQVIQKACHLSELPAIIQHNYSSLNVQFKSSYGLRFLGILIPSFTSHAVRALSILSPHQFSLSVLRRLCGA